MKNSLFGAASLVGAAAAIVLSLLNKPARIGIVDNAQLMSQFVEAVQAQKELESLEQGWKANIKAIKDSLQASVDSLSQHYEKSKEQDRKRMGENLNRWNAEYNRYLSATEKMKADKQKELMGPILEKVNGFVKNWAKENGYGVVLGTGNGGVVLSVADAQNVTSRVISDMNKLYSGSTPKKNIPDQAKASLEK